MYGRGQMWAHLLKKDWMQEEIAVSKCGPELERALLLHLSGLLQ